MTRASRLMALMQVMRDGKRHRALELCTQMNVSERTIYRDMERLKAAGYPVEGTRGRGYHLRDETTLAPISLTPAELEALQLALSIVAEAHDRDLQQAANALAEKVDAALPTQAIPEAEAWKLAASAFSNRARGLSHLPVLRAAIRARQKVALTYITQTGAVNQQTIRPLDLSFWGRIWTLTGWAEQSEQHAQFRLDLVSNAEALPELFVDEPGKTLEDFAGSRKKL